MQQGNRTEEATSASDDVTNLTQFHLTFYMNLQKFSLVLGDAPSQCLFYFIKGLLSAILCNIQVGGWFQLLQRIEIHFRSQAALLLQKMVVLGNSRSGCLRSKICACVIVTMTQLTINAKLHLYVAAQFMETCTFSCIKINKNK